MQTSNEGPVKGLVNSDSGHSAAVRPAVTHRTASARPVSVVVWLLAAGTLGWLLAANDTNTAVRAAPWLFLMCWFVYTSQWRPCLRVDDSGFEVINGLRDHRIPFGKVEDIEVRYTTVIWASGKKYVGWGAPNPPTAFGSGFHHVRDVRSRPFSSLPSNERISQPGTKTGRDAIVAAWHDVRFTGSTSAGGDVDSSWNTPTIVVGIVAVVWAVLTATG